MKLHPSILLASISALVTSVTTVSAVDFHWAAGTGDWETAANWNTGTVPGGGGGNFVYVNNGGTVNINADTNSIQDPFVGRGAGAVGTVNQLTGNHTNVGWSFIGDQGGTGTWNVLGASSLTTGRIYLGGTRDVAFGGTGNMTVNTTGTVSAGSDFSVGTRGATGNLNVQAGTVNAASWMIIGETHGGASATGTVTQTGGVVSNATGDTNGRFWMGSQENGTAVASNATYNISGGTFNGKNSAIGRHYGGTFNQSGGTVNFTSGEEATNFGQFGGSVGTYNLVAGTMNTIGTFNLGDAGTGILSVSGAGVANITGGDGLRMGTVGGSGTLSVTGGGLVSAPFIQKFAGAGQVNVDGGTLQARANAADYFIGLSAAQIDVQAGGLTFDTNNNEVTVTQNLVGAGGLTKSGAGTLKMSAPAYTGNTTVNAGTLTITGAAAYGGTTTVNGGTLSAGDGGATGSVPGAVTVNAGGTFAINRSDDLTNTTAVSGAGSFAKNGANAVTIGAELNGVTGSVQVNGGTLINTAATDIAGASLSVNAGATLLPLGGAVGAINTTALTVGTSSTLNFDFSAGGATFDQIVSTGGITFAGAYTINLFDVGTANPFSTNGTYSLFDYVTSVSGSPSGFTIGNSVIGKSYQLADNGGSTTLQMTIADAVLVAWANAGSGTWSLNTNWSPNITPNVATADVNFTSAITAPSTVDIDGNKTSGKLTFDNANSYTVGGAGTLTLDNGLAAGSIAVVSGNHFINTPLALPNATGVNIATGTALQLGDVSGVGAISKTGNGTLTLNGATGSTGGLIVNGGLVQVGTGGATGVLPTGNVALAAGTRVSFNSTGTSMVANNISGAGAISQDAAGTVTHTGTSNYTGFTDLNTGTFNNDGSIVGTSVIDVNNTTNLNVGSTTSTSGSINVGSGGALSSAGATSFANSLNVSDGGSATISAGTFTQTAGGGINVGTSGTGTLNISGGTTTSSAIIIGVGNGTVGNVNMSGGRLDTNQWTVLGDAAGAQGNVTQTGGTWNQNHTDWLSVGQGGTGVYTMSGNAVLNDQAVVDTSSRGTNKGNIVVGRYTGGVGTWNINDNSVVRIRGLYVGDQAGSTGTVNINNNATVTSQDFDLFLGLSGNGTVNVNGGSYNFNQGWAFIGSNAGSNGQMNVAGGSTSSNRWYIGRSGIGGVTVSAGSFNANDAVVLGENGGGAGTFSVTGGTATLAGDLLAANNTTSTGSVNVTGGLLQQNGGETRIGDNGVGTANFAGGVANLRRVIVGDGAGTNGSSFNVGGTAVVNSTGGAFILGNGSTATSNVSGGTLTIDNELWVGQAAGGNATMDISGGTVTANNWIAIGRDGSTGVVNLSGTGNFVKTGSNGNHVVIGTNGGTGTISQSGGTFSTAGSGQVLLGENAGGTGNWNISDGTASVDGIRAGWSGGGSGNLNLGGTGSITVGNEGIIIGENGTGIVAQTGGTLTVAGNFDVQGNGTGTYALAGGRLNLNGGMDTGNGTFAFGAGTISRSSAGVIDINGPLTTADAAATLKLDTDKTFDISGAFDNTTGLTLELTGMGIPDGPDLGVPATGSFNLGLIGGAITLGDDAFDILNTSLTGFDALFNLGGTGYTATRIDESTSFNAASDSVFWVDEDAGVVTLQYSVVPEPSSMALVIGGLVVLARRRRRA